MLLKNGIPTPPPIKIFPTRDSVRKFKWDLLPEDGFAIKPARGYGGAGIIAFKIWKNETGLTTNNEIFTSKQLESHIFDILDGAFSLQYLPDKAYIEKLVVPHPFFRRLAPLGLADIRIIVFHNIPVMAMMRIPTKQSSGKANLQQGALAAGIDIRTGITTHAISHSNLINKIPDTNIKTIGIKIPDWDKILLLAARTQAISGLGFGGVDIVIDEKEGPMVLEINARPGLKIQNANLASLRTRLERVEDMNIATPERGVEIAKSLFAEKFFEKIDTSPKILPTIFPVTIKSPKGNLTLEAKLDTGAYRSSIDSQLVEDLGIPLSETKVFVQSASGRSFRKTVKLTFEIAGKKITTLASVVNRSHLKYQMIVGRIDLKGFLINPETEFEEADEILESEDFEQE